LVLEEELAYPSLLDSRKILPLFFWSRVRLFMPQTGDGCTYQTLQRRNGVGGRLTERLLTLLGSHNISNANRHHCHGGVAIAPPVRSDEFFGGRKDPFRSAQPAIDGVYKCCREAGRPINACRPDP
jgi:hypothetical protein